MEPGFVLHTTSRLVDVSMVAYDRKGHHIADLKQDDLEIYDEGIRQKILFFTPAGSLTNDSSAVADADESIHSTHAAADISLPSAARAFSNRPAESAQTSTTILLIDSSHLAFSDWTNARTHMLRFLQVLPQGERVALFVVKISSFQVLLEATTDHALVASTIMRWMPSAQDLAQAQEEEARNRQHFDRLHGMIGLPDVSGNFGGAPEALSARDLLQRDFGNNPAGLSLSLLVGVARHLASTPGHKNLVWVTSDNVLADWTDEAISIDKKGRNIEIFALQVQEAMNDANVSLYPLDASQLEAGGISADLKNVQPELSMGSLKGSQVADTSAGNLGRATEEMRQDLHPIQGAIREVAEATGGRTLRRAGDLAAELSGIAADGHAAYLLYFRPSTTADGKYHRIAIKLATRRNIQLRYRTGYQYDREPETLKARFYQAVWRLAEANEIALSAVPVAASN
jgi:VWFA-related protein